MMLASRGAHVVAAARGDNASGDGGGDSAADGQAEAAALDVTDAASIEALIGGRRSSGTAASTSWSTTPASPATS